MVMDVFMSQTGRRLQKDCCYAVGHILNWIQFDLGSRPQAHGDFSYDVGMMLVTDAGPIICLGCGYSMGSAASFFRLRNNNKATYTRPTEIVLN